MNVAVQPELLVWARERASLATDELARKVGSKARPAPIAEWETTGVLPLEKLEAIAAKTHAPFGMLFLAKPPDEPLPIRDFRRSAGASRRPSLNLLQTVYDAQFRQSWFSAHLQAEGAAPLGFVGSSSVSEEPSRAAREAVAKLGIGAAERRRPGGGAASLLWVIARLDQAGVTVQRNGVVGYQTRRRLDRNEFKGFALADRFAPLIFVNGDDWPASQMFTIAHECGHLWLGVSGLPDGDWLSAPDDPTERWCNRFAAELLMPSEEFTSAWHLGKDPVANSKELAPQFTVSALAALVRARNLELISRAAFDRANRELAEDFAESAESPKSSGGDFYRTAKVRLGEHFIREVVASTLEGKLLYTDAFELLGTRRTSVFEGFRKRFLEGETP